MLICESLELCKSIVFDFVFCILWLVLNDRVYSSVYIYKVTIKIHTIVKRRRPAPAFDLDELVLVKLGLGVGGPWWVGVIW